MEVWQCLEILRKSEKTWLFGKEKNQERKLIALNQLSEIGYLSLISDLIPNLKENSKEIQIGTIETIKNGYVRAIPTTWYVALIAF